MDLLGLLWISISFSDFDALLPLLLTKRSCRIFFLEKGLLRIPQDFVAILKTFYKLLTSFLWFYDLDATSARIFGGSCRIVQDSRKLFKISLGFLRIYSNGGNSCSTGEQRPRFWEESQWILQDLLRVWLRHPQDSVRILKMFHEQLTSLLRFHDLVAISARILGGSCRIVQILKIASGLVWDF